MTNLAQKLPTGRHGLKLTVYTNGQPYLGKDIGLTYNTKYTIKLEFCKQKHTKVKPNTQQQQIKQDFI